MNGEQTGSDNLAGDQGTTVGSASSSSSAASAPATGPSATYDSPYLLEGEEIPRQYLAFKIKYLTALHRAWSLSTVIAFGNGNGPIQVQRPEPFHFYAAMIDAGFSHEETQRLWDNYAGEMLHGRGHKNELLNGIREEIARQKDELEHGSNDEPFTPPELMDWGTRRSWTDGTVIAPADPQNSAAMRLIERERERRGGNRAAPDDGIDAIDPLLADVDAFQGLDEALPSGQTAASVVDVLRALDEAIRELDAQLPGQNGHQLHPPGNDSF